MENGWTKKLEQLETELAEARETCEKMRKALEFYAEPEGWKDYDTGMGVMPGDTTHDCGNTARETLKE